MEVRFKLMFTSAESQRKHKHLQSLVLEPWDLELDAHVEYLEGEAENLINQCITANENAAGTYKCTFSFNGAEYVRTRVL